MNTVRVRCLRDHIFPSGRMYQAGREYAVLPGSVSILVARGIVEPIVMERGDGQPGVEHAARTLPKRGRGRPRKVQP